MGISLNPGSILNGNGIDVSSLVTQALAPQNSEIQVLQQQQSALQTQAGLLTGINSDLANLQTAVNSLTDVLGPLTTLTAQSSQPSILTASAQAGAAPGTHNVVVSTLASQSTLYTNAIANANTSIIPSNATSADIQIQVGGLSGVTHDIPITAGSNDTLNTLVSYINSQNWGVTASVLRDSTGARLAIYSGSTGSAGALAVTNNTSNLAFNPPVGGTDATFTVDGIPFSSTTNTVSGAIPGVTLNLVGAVPGVPVQVAVAPDANQATLAVDNFVSAYNTVVGDINQQFTINPATNSEGPLGSDNSLRSLQSSLLADATFSVNNGAFSSLDALGITMNNDGTLSVDQAQLQSAITSNPSGVLNFFQNSSLNGYANNFANDLNKLTDPTQGVLTVDLAQNQASQQALSNSVSNMQDRLSTEQQQLQTDFSQVNALLEAYPSQLLAVQLELGITPTNTHTQSTIG